MFSAMAMIGPDPTHVWPPHPTVEKWIKWLQDELFQGVHGLIQSQKVWSGYNELLGIMPTEAKTPGLFHSWIRSNYVVETAVTVRRLMDRDPRSVSLVRLLEEMVANPGLIERDLWIGRRMGLHDEDELHAAWASWGGDVEQHLDPQIPLRDMCQLLEASRALRTYVNKHVAHMDANRSEFKVGITFGEVAEIVSMVYDVYKRYFEFLTEASLAELTLPPWKSVFKVPWDPR